MFQEGKFSRTDSSERFLIDQSTSQGPFPELMKGEVGYSSDREDSKFRFSSLFNHLSLVHHHNLIRDGANRGYVVSDKNVGDTQFGLSP